jgi:hypothetical protein
MQRSCCLPHFLSVYIAQHFLSMELISLGRRYPKQRVEGATSDIVKVLNTYNRYHIDCLQ